MLKLFTIENGIMREMDTAPEGLEAALPQAVWIDAFAPDEGERAALQRFLRADLPGAEQVEEIEASSRCYVDQAGVHVTLLYLDKVDNRLSSVSVACILRKDFMVTVRERDMADFKQLHSRIKRGQMEVQSATDFLLEALDEKVERHADMLEDIHRRLEEVSHIVLEDRKASLETAVGKLALLEDANGKIRLCLMDTQRDASFLTRHLTERPAHGETLREIMRDLETLSSHANFLFDKISFLMDSTQGFISIQQNQIIKIFSIAAVLSLPPTLVASVYGMNFVNIPELKWNLGYPWALGLMIVSGVAPYLIIRWKRWL